MEKYLAIGTVVLLKEATKKVMIMGYMPITTDNKKFDYSGVLYPEGSLSADTTLLFNKEDIAQIFFEGYKTDEQKIFFDKLEELENSNQQ